MADNSELMTAARRAIRAMADMRTGIAVHNDRRVDRFMPIEGPVIAELLEAQFALHRALAISPVTAEAGEVSEAEVRALAWEISSFLGETPHAVDRGGCEKWEDHRQLARECWQEVARLLAARRVQPKHTANCCECGRIVDTREVKDGGDGFGAELNDGRWTCSGECWEKAVGIGPQQDAPSPDVAGLIEAGLFLLDRLSEFAPELDEDGEAFRCFDGHVSPAMARFRAVLSRLTPPVGAEPVAHTADAMRVERDEARALAMLLNEGGKKLEAKLNSARADGIREGLERAACLIDEGQIVEQDTGQTVEPRSEGNRAGIAYAAAIRALIKKGVE